jgi:GTP 3',8-cyclase
MYCRRPGKDTLAPRSSILHYEDILHLIRAGADMGIDKVRITGGEPLVRRGVIFFINRIVDIPGISDVSLTTNGLLLATHLRSLKEMGISRLNISLDSLNPKTYRDITGSDGFHTVWDTIMRALQMGFSPVKLNMVVLRGVNDHEVPDFAELTRVLPLTVRFIEYMPSSDPLLGLERQILGPDIKRLIERNGSLLPVITKDSSRISERFRFEDACGEMGLISPVSKHFCRLCNRLRLTSNGWLRPCLLSNKGINVHQALKEQDNDHIREKLRQAVILKPRYTTTPDNPNLSVPRLMSAIGG